MLLASVIAASSASAQKLYITNQGGASITVVDQKKLVVDTVIDLTTLGFTANAKPHHAAAERDGSFWYATLIGDGKVLKFDRANRLVGQVSMETPGLLAIDPRHDSLYVGRSMTAVNPPKSLGVIRRSTFVLVDEQEIQIPRPHALVASRDGKWIHAASLAENRIASLETATGRVTLTTLPGDATRSMVQFTVSPDGRRHPMVRDKISVVATLSSSAMRRHCVQGDNRLLLVRPGPAISRRPSSEGTRPCRHCR